MRSLLDRFIGPGDHCLATANRRLWFLPGRYMACSAQFDPHNCVPRRLLPNDIHMVDLRRRTCASDSQAIVSWDLGELGTQELYGLFNLFILLSGA